MVWEKEKVVIENSKLIVTKSRLCEDFKKIGLKAGDIVLVHSSLSKIGWIPGGPILVIEALMEVLTPNGTLVMPTHSSENSEPSLWHFPPVPEKWWPIIRKEMPYYDPKITPTRGMGKIPEIFRTYPDVIRSNHPQCSFAAWGKHANEISSNHPFIPCFGENSPVGRIYELNGKILLLGVGHGNNTSLHLAECKASIPNQPHEIQGAAILKNGIRKWITGEDLEYDDDDFVKVGEAFEKRIGYIPQKIGIAESRLLNSRKLIDFAVEWFRANRHYPNSK